MTVTGNIATRLKKRREELGLSRVRLAHACGVHPRLVERIEGGTNITVLSLAAICAGLGIKLADVFIGEPEPKAKHPPIILTRGERRLLEAVEGLDGRSIRVLINMAAYMQAANQTRK